MEQTQEQLKQPTKKQIGQMRRAYVTVVHGTVRACGHKAKFNATKQPSNNCVDCWVAFFSTTADLEALHKMLTEEGVDKFTAKYGSKFVNHFHGYLAMYLMKGIEAAKENTQELI